MELLNSGWSEYVLIEFTQAYVTAYQNGDKKDSEKVSAFPFAPELRTFQFCSALIFAWLRSLDALIVAGCCAKLRRLCSNPTRCAESWKVEKASIAVVGKGISFAGSYSCCWELKSRPSWHMLAGAFVSLLTRLRQKDMASKGGGRALIIEFMKYWCCVEPVWLCLLIEGLALRRFGRGGLTSPESVSELCWNRYQHRCRVASGQWYADRWSLFSKKYFPNRLIALKWDGEGEEHSVANSFDHSERNKACHNSPSRCNPDASLRLHDCKREPLKHKSSSFGSRSSLHPSFVFI